MDAKELAQKLSKAFENWEEIDTSLFRSVGYREKEEWIDLCFPLYKALEEVCEDQKVAQIRNQKMSKDHDSIISDLVYTLRRELNYHINHIASLNKTNMELWAEAMKQAWSQEEIQELISNLQKE